MRHSSAIVSYRVVCRVRSGWCDSRCRQQISDINLIFLFIIFSVYDGASVSSDRVSGPGFVVGPSTVSGSSPRRRPYLAVCLPPRPAFCPGRTGFLPGRTARARSEPVVLQHPPVIACDNWNQNLHTNRRVSEGGIRRIDCSLSIFRARNNDLPAFSRTENTSIRFIF
jgi:hypothetical protein